ncbi:MAG: hypothetical protein C4520_00435 [Candidatus Abyssobacteria bacterium SURF_5]|uniref:DNRLRE domain-containing protein n=1 Tax=Abyssobacteria bacterium (strain SURF_5) TaxID=2093360 RepID=A0A3A4PFR9_ABYX5|nr:MAG: hypothetical protein C4520_00435 [Candidatus Abyssubacteria bacterium SURF_5]
MRRKIFILFLCFLFNGSAFGDSAFFSLANRPQEDAFSICGSRDFNGYNTSSGWQYFGFCQDAGCYYNAYWRWPINIPKGSTITAAHVQLRADYTNFGELAAEFSALLPDNRWDNENGFAATNYQRGTDLNSILRQGTPVLWQKVPDWTYGARYDSPDLSNLVQARIDNEDYDPLDERGRYFGLALSYVSGSHFRTATQQPDDATFTARLYIEWIPGPPETRSAETEMIFQVADTAQEDTFSSQGPVNKNGFNNKNGRQYFGYVSGTSSTYNAYWRWFLSIPRGSTITSASLKIRSAGSTSGYLDAALQALAPDGSWESPAGFSRKQYVDGNSLSDIPRRGDAIPWSNIPWWTTGAWFYSPDVAALVQEHIDDPDYDPANNQRAAFGLVLYPVAGTGYRIATQEPVDNRYTAQLHVKWLPPQNVCEGGGTAKEGCDGSIVAPEECTLRFDKHDHICQTTNIPFYKDDVQAGYLSVMGGRYAYTDCPEEKLPRYGIDQDFDWSSDGRVLTLNFHPINTYTHPDRPGLSDRLWVYIGLSRTYPDDPGITCMPYTAVLDETYTGLNYSLKGSIRVSMTNENWLKFDNSGAIRIGGTFLDTISKKAVESDNYLNHVHSPYWNLSLSTIYEERSNYILLRWSDLARLSNNGDWINFSLDLSAISEEAAVKALGNPIRTNIRWGEYIVGPEFPSGEGELTIQLKDFRLVSH